MSNFGFDEDNIVNKYLELQSSRYLSTDDKERLEQFMDSYFQAKSNFIRQLVVMSEIEITKMEKEIATIEMEKSA